MHIINKHYELSDGRYVCSIGYYYDNEWKNICYFIDEDEAFRFCNYLNGGAGIPFDF